MSGKVGYIRFVEMNRTPPCSNETDHSTQQSALARSVPAKNADNLTMLDDQIDVIQDSNAAVASI
jgi:hypothetical protein